MRNYEVFFEVFEVLKDPNKYQAKIKELQDSYNAYKGAVEAVTKISSVNDYVASIQQKEEKAKAVLQQANVDAENLVKIAKDQADRVLQDAQNTYQQAVMAREENTVRLSETKKEQQFVKQEVKKLEELRRSLEAKEQALNALAEDLEARKTKLMAALQ